MYGKISCVAKGARRPRSALLAGTQMFCFGEYLMFKGTSTYHINSVEPIEVFYNIRTDLDKLKYAVNIIKIIQDVTHENQNCFNILQLLLNTLYVISETDKNLDLVLSIFKIRLLCILGFTPKIYECVNCKEKDKLSVEWSLQGIDLPIGVSSYQLNQYVAQNIVDKLPTEEEINLHIDMGSGDVHE